MPVQKCFHILLFICAFTYVMTCPFAQTIYGSATGSHDIEKKIVNKLSKDSCRFIFAKFFQAAHVDIFSPSEAFKKLPIAASLHYQPKFYILSTSRLLL